MARIAKRVLAFSAGTILGLAAPIAAFAAPQDRPENPGAAPAHAGSHANDNANGNANDNAARPQQGQAPQQAPQQEPREQQAQQQQPPADPPGNNGTIKVDGLAFDDHPNNEPHVGCRFEIDFYGFDEGEDFVAQVSFVAWSPTRGGDTPLLTDEVFIGEDGNEGGGSVEGLDAHREYDLSAALAGIEPHPQQGWHVKLTIHADGSQGADVKHKVFWVQACEGVLSTSTTTEATTTTTTGATTTTAAGSATTTTLGSTGTSAGEAVLGESLERPLAVEAVAAQQEAAGAPGTEVRGVSLARTGLNVLALAGLGAALVAGGSAARRRARR